MKTHLFAFLLSAAFLLPSSGSHADEPTPPAPLPPQPWHLADLWWDFQKPTPHFESLDMDVTIDRDVPSTVNLYVAPCGLGELGGVRFYGGLQTNANGWRSKEKHERAFMGKGGIFSRWGKGKLSVAQARGAADSYYEAADYEGDFVSVRRPFNWSKGTYTWSLRACDNETVDGQDYTWVSCFITAHGTGLSRYIGSLRFEGKDLTFWPHHSAFVEAYSSARMPRTEVPEVKVTFGYPRVNGQPPPLKAVHVVHPAPGERSGAPDYATAAADGSNVIVTVGPLFHRDPSDRRHALAVTPPATQP